MNANVTARDRDGRPVEFSSPIRWVLCITEPNGMRQYTLDHEYRMEGGALAEAEDLADQVYESTDIGWAVGPKQEDFE